MEYSVYVAKTFMVALTKIGPVVGFIVFGYLIFIKLPFLLFRSSLRASRDYDQSPVAMREEYKKAYTVNDYNKFMNQQARLEASSTKKDEPKQEEKQERRKEERKKEAPRAEKPTGISPEENIFSFSAGQRFTKDELKKRYRDLLKESHPDKVAAMGPDFKKLAEVKTKEINSAYQKLKAKAA
jgi:hypothetical protein